jgi:molybdopterin-dependent oxidoreductase alpha subunit
MQAQPPKEDQNLKIKRPKKTSVGLAAVFKAMQHVKQEMGLLKGNLLLLKVNQTKGFDCPGCAWADPTERSKFEFCENGAKAVAEEASNQRVSPDFFAQHAINELQTWTDYALGKSGRLTQPMILRAGASHYEKIEWTEAFALLAKHLQALASPDEAAFYTSGRTSNEAAFLYQLFVRRFGTNNLPDCSNMCHESSGVALSETIGIGKGTVKLEDFEQAELIMVMGQNPGTNHPRMLSALQKAKRAGAKILTINPLPEAGLMNFQNPQEIAGILGFGTDLTDIFLQVRINGDVALLKGIMKCWQENGEKEAFDLKFIQEKTEGYEAFLADLAQTDRQECVEKSGIALAQMQTVADLLKTKQKIIVTWAMGLTQHKNAVATIQEVVNLLLLKGSIGKPGAGLCPVRGHSNVQGDRTMGIWEKPPQAFLAKLAQVFDFQPPTHHGYDTVDTIKAMAEGKVKVFVAMGGNFLSATPDTEFTAKALSNCDLTVQISTKLNRSHLITGKTALILPCLGRTEKDWQVSGEQFVSVENSMGIVHSSQGSLKPASEYLLSELMIVAQMAEATLAPHPRFEWCKWVENYDLIRDLIEKTIPGFENYNQKVRQNNGFYLPNAPREGTFNTPNQKAKFTVHPLPKTDLQVNEFILMTIRSHDQFNTTIYGLDDRYRGIYQGRRVVLMNEADMQEFKLQKGQKIDLISCYEDGERKAEDFVIVPYSIPRRCLAAYFPETNVLVPIHQVADQSHTPISKYIKVMVKSKLPSS